MIINQKILITGGTGSLGKSLAQELATNNQVIVYSRNEERQYEMMKLFNNPNIQYRIGDVRDTETLKFALRGCDLAIHAAAMKDLIMIEDQPTQGVLNNIEGSRSFIQAVIETPSVKKAIAISTDKAASPSNAYGMTKYIMERLFIEANKNSDKTFVCSRFGNMIDSSAALPTFWKEHPELDVKITHPEMCRFFFTIKDAVKTVLDTIEKGQGGEIYIPKMKAANILDILQIIFKKEKFEVIGLFLEKRFMKIWSGRVRDIFVLISEIIMLFGLVF
jgi:UDP-N-acetylglucosamine 4,6-dehydratase